MIEHLGGEGMGAARSTMPLSPAVRAGDFVYVSGQVPTDAKGEVIWGNVETQTRAVMDKLKAVLAETDCTLADVVKTTVYLADAREFVGFNGAYSSYFEPGKRPARTTVQAPLMIDIKVEIDAVAYCPRKP
ncbi:MAG: RidA family protein [Paracoccaceae bacterium]